MRALSIYSFLLACVCTAALAYSCAYLVPKAFEPSLIGSKSAFAPHIESAARLGKTAFAVTAFGFILGLVGLSVALATPLWKRLNEAIVATCGIILSAASVLFLCWHGFALWNASYHSAWENKMTADSYRRTLTSHGVLDEGDGRMAKEKELLREALSDDGSVETGANPKDSYGLAP